MAEFQRDKTGERLWFGGVDFVHALDRLPPNKSPYAQNCRAYWKGGVVGRNLLTDAIVSGLPTPIHTVRKLIDTTPNGPSSGYSFVIGASTNLYIWNSDIGLVLVATGLSGNPLSMVPFRPNTSVQPWMYWSDSAPMGNVTLETKYLGANASGPAGTPVNFPSNGMGKTRSDGLTFKGGIEEPQLAPVVSTTNPAVLTNGTLNATSIPWTNFSGQNSDYDYGETHGYPDPTPDGSAPFIVNCKDASFVTITAITGTANINGDATATPTTAGPSPASATNPGHFVMQQGTGDTPPVSATVVIGAFTDGAGNVVPAGQAPLYIPAVVDVGGSIGSQITVPYGAQQFQIGINSTGNTFASNSGSFQIYITVTTNALPTVTAILGALTLWYFDDSPTSGPVGTYIWRNPDDPGGSGPTRSTSDAVGSTSGNSFIFDASFGSSASPVQPAGIPGLPGIGSPTVPMLWTDLSPESVAIGSNSVFAAPLTRTNPNNTQFANFNFCVQGNIYFPSSGQFTFVLTNHDDCMWGIGGGVTLVSATPSGSGEGSGVQLSEEGQTITVVGGYPLLPRQEYTSGSGGNYAETTVVVNVPAAGIYPIEIDYDYWYHSGRILLLQCSPTAGASPTIIPPLPVGVREDTQYRYTYRSSATGASSNPSPESAVESVPVTSNTVTSVWSPDPQVDLVDYWRIDSVTASFTYVNTGPNDNANEGTNTPVTDSLSDTELGSDLLSYDNYEPFPSIDLPQKGICDISGGVITWVSGGAIGGTETGFNPRWLAGTVIEIGSPTSLDYVMIARPVVTPASSTSSTSNTSTGTSTGGGSPWSTPGNIDSNSGYASVVLGTGGGGTYNPSATTGTVSATQSGVGSNEQSLTFSGWPSVVTFSATAYITLSGTLSASGTGSTGIVLLLYSVNGGSSFTEVAFWESSFASTTVPIPLTGVTNLNQVVVRVQADAVVGLGGNASASVTVTNCYATTASSGSDTSQTLVAAIKNLTVPIQAQIAGVEITYSGYYTGAAPTLNVNLSVGTEIDSVSLTTSPAPYSNGSNSDLWGYSNWTPGTLPTLTVNFNASCSLPSTVHLNSLVITIYYPEVPAGSTITIPGVPDGNNQQYVIEEPILAAQPLPYIWGPTDNINFAYGVGDPLRPGTLYWCAGSNLDAAPDTNQQDLTDPGEPLVNGAISGGLGVVLSIKRAWLILPNFFNALATVTGVEGSTWSLQESSITRGLYMPRCVVVSGGGNIFFRVDDGIHVSKGGAASESITDQDLYPLFPHENEDGGISVPQPVTIAGYTVHPPNDSLPQAQRMSYSNGYVYYDYLDATSTPRTFVFDEAAMGWVPDVYTPTVTIHAPNEGQSVQGFLTGCSDGTVRQLASGGTEAATAVFLTRAEDFSDTRGTKKIADLYIETEHP